jgi:hypothetical protein
MDIYRKVEEKDCCRGYMGQVADFIVATPDEAMLYAQSGGSLTTIERSEWKNYSSLSIDVLCAVLRGQKVHDEIDLSTENIQFFADGSEWLYCFPDDYIDLIADVDVRKVSEIASTWASSEDVPGDEGVDHEPALLELRTLAISAKSSNRGLFLWGSL